MKRLEETRPPGRPALLIHAALTRVAVGTPQITSAHLLAAQLPNVEIVQVAALSELALCELVITLGPDIPVELAVIVSTMKYAERVSQVMFGEGAMKTPETFIHCAVVKAQWRGTSDWDSLKIHREEWDEQPAETASAVLN
ncbi:hypothetical protein [Deinococcus sp.]|uniref:hypothetical protein n=1 Tax=Deinococcus sp. TaxID=47478 RepID=UPI0025BCE766|nr:hypothetical protein [Deinococcus sp.]